MKHFKVNNRILLLFGMMIFMGISSCKKAIEYKPLGDGGPKYIGFMDYGGPEGFKKSNLSFNSALPNQSLEVRLLYTGAGTFDNDVTITVGADAAALAAYNAAQPASGIKYTMAPASIYSLPTTTAIIKKGNTMSEPFTIVFHPDQLDPAVSYMLPLSITGISGAPADVAKAPGTGTAYLHVIGNFLAGKYTWRYRRWQTDDTTTVPLQDVLNTVSLAPLSATQIMTRETYTETFIDPAGGVVLGFTETGGVLSNFGLSFLPSTIAGISAGGFLLLDGPKFVGTGFNLVGSSSTNFIGTNFGTYIKYQNSTPAFRSLVNNFVKIP